MLKTLKEEQKWCHFILKTTISAVLHIIFFKYLLLNIMEIWLEIECNKKWFNCLYGKHFPKYLKTIYITNYTTQIEKEKLTLQYIFFMWEVTFLIILYIKL